jgi:hypothetical protein
LELLHEAVPGAAVIAALVNPTNPSAEAEVRELKEAADSRRRADVLPQNNGFAAGGQTALKLWRRSGSLRAASALRCRRREKDQGRRLTLDPSH